MCTHCIKHQDLLPPVGCWVPCFKMKELKGKPFLVQIDSATNMTIKKVKHHPMVNHCPGCNSPIVDLISTIKLDDTWRFYTPRTS